MIEIYRRNHRRQIDIRFCLVSRSRLNTLYYGIHEALTPIGDSACEISNQLRSSVLILILAYTIDFFYYFPSISVRYHSTANPVRALFRHVITDLSFSPYAIKIRGIQCFVQKILIRFAITAGLGSADRAYGNQAISRVFILIDC